jgi:DNA replication and repair protein RecF
LVIKEVQAERWRNLDRLVLRPSTGLTVLFGSNGQGKTNVIEAIYFLATLRSFRTSRVRELVRIGEPGSELGSPPGESRARLEARVTTPALERQVEVEVGEGMRVVRLDGKPARAAAAIFGALSVVLFVPEDLLLPRAAPSARRKYLDLAVFNVERGYYREASAFQRVLKSRNALLRTGRASPVLLETYDEELARTGARVVLRRRRLVADLAPRMAALFKALHGDLPVELRYQSDARVEAAGDEASVREALLGGLEKGRAVDERRRFTGFGPHTDDLEIRLSGRLAREHASQGQLRSLVLALKLAELGNVEERRGDAPVLLLDDVPSELDPERRRFLFEMIASLSCQTVISVADREVIPPLVRRVDFLVVGGRLAEA